MKVACRICGGLLCGVLVLLAVTLAVLKFGGCPSFLEKAGMPLICGNRGNAGGSYSITSGSFNVDEGGYVCGGVETRIFYPESEGSFPLVVYLHGTGSADGSMPGEIGIDGAEHAISEIASLGLIVVAPFTAGISEVCSSKTQWQEMVAALGASRDGGEAAHPALDKVDWSRSGAWGYSMGGRSVALGLEDAADAGFNMQAVLFSHGANHGEKVHVPSMYVTGTKDHGSSTPDVVKEEFNKNRAQQKAFINLRKEDHLEPMNSGKSLRWEARFFACHLRDERCDDIYGKGEETICSDDGLVDCVVKGSPSSGSLESHATNLMV